MEMELLSVANSSVAIFVDSQAGIKALESISLGAWGPVQTGIPILEIPGERKIN